MGVLGFLLVAVVISCHFCGDSEKFSDDGAYTKHMFSYLKNRPDFAMFCGYPGCKLKFKNYKTRMAHKKDHVLVMSSTVDDSDGANNVDKDVDIPLVSSEEVTDDAGGSSEVRDDFEIGVSKLNNEFNQAQFILSLRAKNLPANVINAVMENTENIAHSCIDDFASKIEAYLKSKNVDYSDADLNKFKQESSKCFEGVKNRWFQDKYFTENMDVLEPKKIILGPRVCTDVSKEGPNPHTYIIYHSFCYASLLDSLKTLCVNQNFTDLLKPLVPSSDGIIRGCFDGSCFKDNPILFNNPDALVVVLYYDEVNLVDTASSRPVKYGMFYYTVLNIEEEHRSGLHAICLLMAVDCNLISEYGINQFLMVIVEDLLVLEDGLQLPDGNVVFGSLLVFMGDNAASHLVDGFKCGFTAHRVCRFCYSVLEDVRCMCIENLNNLRTPEQYDHQVETLERLENNQKEFRTKSTDFGVNYRSVLNSLPHFHVVKQLVPDLFHDLLEGCWPTTIQQILRKYCLGKEKLISLKELNEKIAGFDYGYTETRPTTISEGHLEKNAKLHQTGSQMWTLANILPIILEPLVEEDDENWLNYLCLLKITALVFGRSISKGGVGYLAELIEEYLTSFQKLYRGLIPKQHWLIHYPRLIICHGVLSTYSTMRMEGKHRYFVDVMTNAQCYKNPSLTMAKQHQLYQAAKFSGEVAKISTFGRIRIVNPESLPFRQLLPRDIVIQTASWYCAQGVRSQTYVVSF